MTKKQTAAESGENTLQKNKHKAPKRVHSNFSGYVYNTFILTIIATSVVFGLKRRNYVDCEKANNYVRASSYTVGSLIQFQDNTSGAKNWEWDFGDGSPTINRAQALHKFEKAGQYTVTLTINGNCISEHFLNITGDGPPIDSTYMPVFDLPKSVQIGQSVKFKDKTTHARSWQWRFGDGSEINATVREPSHVYTSPGIKTVSLMVNHDPNYITTKKIVVIPKKEIRKKMEVPIKLKPVDHYLTVTHRGPMDEIRDEIPLAPPREEPEGPKLAPAITDEEFEQMLFQIANRRKTKEDLFDQLCGNFDIPVVKNDKELITFSELCKDIKGRKIKINALNIHRNDLRCITGVTIFYRKKLF
ncbi:PKD domain-containing protein [Xanthovirga aplysinae]|uniref:PKD domain-containing protein n=1 Tax=Xanthovirga aplysinae TaxID=2529853 RepID=UPI0012BCFACD|nr:PKD domain-containing protein [Xanthovirga aplysinae]MTI31748.1 PKD domain-containing protein [Xanthovirga aplysinae]